MTAIRLYTVLVALVLMIGEGYRSWGAGRPVITWMDDMVLGALMDRRRLVGGPRDAGAEGLPHGRLGHRHRRVFLSLMSKIGDPSSTIAGNLQLSVLIWALAVIFAGAVLGFIASLIIPFKPQAA